MKAAANPLYRTPFVAYTNAGVCARSAGNLEQAERYLRQALTSQVDYPETYAQLAGVLHDRGNNLHARAFVERYLAVAPATPDMLLLGYNIEVAMKDEAAAAAFRARLEKEFPNSEQLRRVRQTPGPELRMNSRGRGSLRRARCCVRLAKPADLSIEEVADRLRLNEALVLAMEEDRFGLLGAPVFARGHLRNYAALVGAAEAEVMAAFDVGDVPEPTFLPALDRAPVTRSGARGGWIDGRGGAGRGGRWRPPGGCCATDHGTETAGHPRHERPARRRAAVLAARRGGRARTLRRLRLPRDARAAGRARGTLQALDRRAHRHRREGDVQLRRPRRRPPEPPAGGDRGPGASRDRARAPAQPEAAAVDRRPDVPPRAAAEPAATGSFTRSTARRSATRGPTSTPR